MIRAVTTSIDHTGPAPLETGPAPLEMRPPRVGLSLFWRTFFLLSLLLIGSIVAWLQTFRALEFEPRQRPAVEPVAPILRRGDADIGAVDPGIPGALRGGAAVGVQDPPGFLFPVPDDGRIGGAVEYRVAK